MASFPHCDDLVLHAPGECFYCDKYAETLQAKRIAAGANFTGQSDPTKKPCPSLARRPLETIERWSGNVAVKEGERHTHMGVEFTVGE